METKTWSIHWYDRETEENTAIEIYTMTLDHVIEEAEFMTDESIEYFIICESDDDDGEIYYTSK